MEKCPPCNKKCSVTCLHSKCHGKCSNVVSNPSAIRELFVGKLSHFVFLFYPSVHHASKIVTGSVNIFLAALFVELHAIDCHVIRGVKSY